jgi:quinol monooxygenase YgiN
MYGLSGKIKAQLGQRDALIDILLQAAKGLREYEGCYVYIVSSAPDDPDGIWVTEVWRSQADHQASLLLESTKAAIASARHMIAGSSDRAEFTPLGGKGLPD